MNLSLAEIYNNESERDHFHNIERAESNFSMMNSDDYSKSESIFTDKSSAYDFSQLSAMFNKSLMPAAKPKAQVKCSMIMETGANNHQHPHHREVKIDYL